MSSVLIKGLRMPTEDEIIIRIQPNGAILDRCGHRLLQKAIQVPPHGRLIDADAISDELGASDRDFYVQDWLDGAPTVIQAEGTKL